LSPTLSAFTALVKEAIAALVDALSNHSTKALSDDLAELGTIDHSYINININIIQQQ
jgi:hypothetical protein